MPDKEESDIILQIKGDTFHLDKLELAMILGAAAMTLRQSAESKIAHQEEEPLKGEDYLVLLKMFSTSRMARKLMEYLGEETQEAIKLFEEGGRKI